MTENKALKKAIRKRMSETGEPYNTARRTVLAKHQSDSNASLIAPPQRRAGKPKYAGTLKFHIESPTLKYLRQVQARNQQLSKFVHLPL
ncbi:hypothetical protein, partial [Streptomyces massasporeus]|uniref:hypothetical protein n=1 Tax=Streptomyces massasporeus TaxID=67324 RepID=UPI0036F8AB36